MAAAPAPHPGGGAGTGMSKKLGPLPIWAWALIGVAVGYYIYKKQQASAAATASQATLTSTPATTTSGAAPSSTLSAAAANPDTQTAWTSTAAQGAIGAGYAPTAVENALANWQNGQPLDSTQEGVLNWILKNYGSPPNGVQPVYTGTLPSPSSGTGATGGSGGGFYPTPQPVPTGPAQTISTSYAPSSPYVHIDSPSAGSADAAAGMTIYGETQPGVYVPVVQNGQRTQAWDSYANSSNPGLFLSNGG